MPLVCKVKAGAHVVHYDQHVEGNTELARCEDNDITSDAVADCLSADSSGADPAYSRQKPDTPRRPQVLQTTIAANVLLVR